MKDYRHMLQRLEDDGARLSVIRRELREDVERTVRLAAELADLAEFWACSLEPVGRVLLRALLLG